MAFTAVMILEQLVDAALNGGVVIARCREAVLPVCSVTPFPVDYLAGDFVDGLLRGGCSGDTDFLPDADDVRVRDSVVLRQHLVRCAVLCGDAGERVASDYRVDGLGGAAGGRLR